MQKRYITPNVIMTDTGFIINNGMPTIDDKTLEAYKAFCRFTGRLLKHGYSAQDVWELYAMFETLSQPCILVDYSAITNHLRAKAFERGITAALRPDTPKYVESLRADHELLFSIPKESIMSWLKRLVDRSSKLARLMQGLDVGRQAFDYGDYRHHSARIIAILLNAEFTISQLYNTTDNTNNALVSLLDYADSLPYTDRLLLNMSVEYLKQSNRVGHLLDTIQNLGEADQAWQEERRFYLQWLNETDDAKES